MEIIVNFHIYLILILNSTIYCYNDCLNAGMIPQFFKKQQESLAQVCHCNLASRSGSLLENDKFLTRLQSQPLNRKLQVNQLERLGNQKQRQPKFSLKLKEKRLKSTQNMPLAAMALQEKQKWQLMPTFNKRWYKPANQTQKFNKMRLSETQEEQYTFQQTKSLRKHKDELRLQMNQQNQYHRANNQKPTICRNITQLKNTVQNSAVNNYSKKDNASDYVWVSASSQQTKQSVEPLPKSKAFSTNLIRRDNVIHDLYFANAQNLPNISFKQQTNNQLTRQTSAQFTDLVFKSAQSFSDSSSDQFSELQCSNQYLSYPSIAQSSWSISLNQIFAKKMKRLSHNPNV